MYMYEPLPLAALPCTEEATVVFMFSGEEQDGMSKFTSCTEPTFLLYVCKEVALCAHVFGSANDDVRCGYFRILGQPRRLRRGIHTYRGMVLSLPARDRCDMKVTFGETGYPMSSSDDIHFSSA